MLLWTFVYEFLCKHIFFISLGYISRIRIAWLHGNSMFNILNNCQTVFQSGCIILHSPRQCMRILISSHCHSGEKNESYEIFKKEIISLVDSFMRVTLYWQKKTKILQEKKIHSDISHEHIWKKSFSKY